MQDALVDTHGPRWAGERGYESGAGAGLNWQRDAEGRQPALHGIGFWAPAVEFEESGAWMAV